MPHAAHVRRHFDAAAGRIARNVTPVTASLLAHFAGFAAPHADDTLLDAGTGPGTLAHRLAPHVRCVVGLDLSARMLNHAAHAGHPAISGWVQADLQHLPFPPQTFSLVTAAFALHSTDPNASLPALRRVMRPGGRLAILEWGPRDPARTIVETALAELPDPGVLPAVDGRAVKERAADDSPRWDAYIQDVEDYRERLEDLGFTIEHADESAPQPVWVSIPAFVRFILATDAAYAAYRSLPLRQRAACDDAIRARLQPLTTGRDWLEWQPVLFRVRARRTD